MALFQGCGEKFLDAVSVLLMEVQVWVPQICAFKFFFYACHSTKQKILTCNQPSMITLLNDDQTKMLNAEKQLTSIRQKQLSL